jgi:hypothetical protein
MTDEGCVSMAVPRIHSASEQASFEYWGARLWNAIPRDIRSSGNRELFHEKYSLYLCSHMSAYDNDNYDLYDFV